MFQLSGFYCKVSGTRVFRCLVFRGLGYGVSQFGSLGVVDSGLGDFRSFDQGFCCAPTTTDTEMEAPVVGTISEDTPPPAEELQGIWRSPAPAEDPAEVPMEEPSPGWFDDLPKP